MFPNFKGSLRNAVKKTPGLASIIQRLIRKRPVINTIQRRIKGKNNRIFSRGAILSGVSFFIRGDNNTVDIGEGAYLEGLKIHIKGSNHRIIIGKGCRFSRRFGLGGLIWIEGSTGLLEIGEGTTMQTVDLAVLEPGSRLIIGKDCMFAYDIDVRTGDSHEIVDPNTGERLNFAKDIRIGDHVWVAAHAILLKGVELGDNSIVSAGSVVTKAFGPNVIIGGNPAKVIKEGITWKR